MVVNRQRCCFLGDGLLEHRQQLKEAAALAKAGRKRGTAASAADDSTKSGGGKKRKTAKYCCNNSCMAEQIDNAAGWNKCKTKGCKKHFCPECDDEREAHYAVCQQAFQKREESKKLDA
jgi:hypothetical protein